MNTYKDLTEFYPTPPSLIRKMMNTVEDPNHIDTILEPSAGAGDLVQGVIDYITSETAGYYRHDKDYLWDRVDCVEISESLRSILTGKGLRVVHDNFLTLRSYQHYDLIVMNPPFSDGEKHLLKALEMQKRGGEIVCLLNAETIKNPYTNSRKELIKQLEKHGATTQYATDEFMTSEAQRKSSVEVAIIHVLIPDQVTGHFVLDELKKAAAAEESETRNEWMVESDFIKQIIQRYDFEARTGLTLIDEYNSLSPLMLDDFEREDKESKTYIAKPEPILQLTVDDKHSNCGNIRNRYIEVLRKKYWNTLFRSPEFTKLLTSNMQKDLYNKVDELKHYDFSVYNINQLKIQIYGQITKGVEDTIIDLFDLFTHKGYWDEHSNNIHYFNGWKTNKAFYVTKKVIIRLCAFSDWSGDFQVYRAREKLSDIEKTFDYLDGGRTDPVDLQRILEAAKRNGQTRKIETKYFHVTFYKKGTCHIEFRDMELLKKFNLYGCQRKGFLPPSYGKKTYTEMDTEERDVIDEFEGKEEYAKVMSNPDFYIRDAGKLLLSEVV